MFFIPYLLGKLLLITQDLYKAFLISLRSGYAFLCGLRTFLSEYLSLDIIECDTPREVHTQGDSE